MPLNNPPQPVTYFSTELSDVVDVGLPLSWDCPCGFLPLEVYPPRHRLHLFPLGVVLGLAVGRLPWSHSVQLVNVVLHLF